MRFGGCERGGQHRRVGRASVQVEQHEPVGVFGLRGAGEAPARGGGQVGDLVGEVRGDPTFGGDHQSGAGQPFLGEPLLEAVQQRLGQLVCGGDRIVGGGGRGVGGRLVRAWGAAGQEDHVGQLTGEQGGEVRHLAQAGQRAVQRRSGRTEDGPARRVGRRRGVRA
ncbi:hypothetical protein J7462_29305 [Micromonospora sp. RL09-050-HVF-A]|nr:hypothetical protein [Micromonospora sp. RL09-050-HVF-A]